MQSFRFSVFVHAIFSNFNIQQQSTFGFAEKLELSDVFDLGDHLQCMGDAQNRAMLDFPFHK